MESNGGGGGCGERTLWRGNWRDEWSHGVISHGLERGGGDIIFHFLQIRKSGEVLSRMDAFLRQMLGFRIFQEAIV